jgi:hypothetical protein
MMDVILETLTEAALDIRHELVGAGPVLRESLRRQLAEALHWIAVRAVEIAENDLEAAMQ